MNSGISTVTFVVDQCALQPDNSIYNYRMQERRPLSITIIDWRRDDTCCIRALWKMMIIFVFVQREVDGRVITSSHLFFLSFQIELKMKTNDVIQSAEDRSSLVSVRWSVVPLLLENLIMSMNEETMRRIDLSDDARQWWTWRCGELTREECRWQPVCVCVTESYHNNKKKKKIEWKENWDEHWWSRTTRKGREWENRTGAWLMIFSHLTQLDRAFISFLRARIDGNSSHKGYRMLNWSWSEVHWTKQPRPDLFALSWSKIDRWTLSKRSKRRSSMEMEISGTRSDHSRASFVLSLLAERWNQSFVYLTSSFLLFCTLATCRKGKWSFDIFLFLLVFVRRQSRRREEG